MIIAQFTAIAGAAVVGYLAYLYIAFRSAEERVYRRAYRKRFTRTMLAGVFGAYTIGVAFPHSGGWPADIGRTIGRIVWSSSPSFLTLEEATGTEILLRWLKILGLIVYTVVWISASFSAQFLVKIYRGTFG